MRGLNERHIKTLHLTNAFHEDSGGISTSYRSMMREAERQERLIRLIVPGKKDCVEDVNRFARIYYISSPRAPVFDSRYRLLLPHKYLFSMSAIRKILISENPDLIEATDKYTLNWLMGLIRRGRAQSSPRPVLVGMSCERMDDNIEAFTQGGAATRRLARFYIKRFYLPMFDFHIANSEYTAEELRQAARPDLYDRILVSPRGVDYDHFSIQRRSVAARNYLLEKTNGDPGTRVLLYAGRLSPEKNVRLLVGVMERLVGDGRHDYRMIVAGDGPLAQWLQHEGRTRLAGRIRLLGHLRDRDELAYLYSNADAFVHPNPREPFGIAPLEAMASGCPVVAPSAGGILSYANAGNAWLARPTADDFATAIRDIFNNPQRRKERIESALKTAIEHNWPAMASKIFSIYDQISCRFQDERAERLRLSWDDEQEKVNRSGEERVRSSHL